MSERVVLTSISEEELIYRITERAAYCRFGGEYIGTSNDVSSLSNLVDPDVLKNSHREIERTFAVDSFSLHLEECGELGGGIKQRTSGKVALENPDCLFHLEKTPFGFVLGLSKTRYKRCSWRARRPRARRCFLPSAIYPKLARLLVNLSRVREGEIFLDPFCGTGSLLIESSLMGMRTIGAEITRWIARGAKLNLRGFSLDFEGILRTDSTFSHLPLTRVDGVSTDVPYGRASSTKGKTTRNILLEFLDSLKDSLQSGNHCVIMHPSTVPLAEILDGNSFQLEEQHLLYVHRTLTRAISVLRRV